MKKVTTKNIIQNYQQELKDINDKDQSSILIGKITPLIIRLKSIFGLK